MEVICAGRQADGGLVAVICGQCGCCRLLLPLCVVDA